MEIEKIAKHLENGADFSRQDYIKAFNKAMGRECSYQYADYTQHRFIKSGEMIRIGHNRYCLSSKYNEKEVKSYVEPSLYYRELLKGFRGMGVFTKDELEKELAKEYRDFTKQQLRGKANAVMGILQRSGDLTRAGRGKYIMGDQTDSAYTYSYSRDAKRIAAIIKEMCPGQQFRIVESFQYHGFVRHKMKKNVLVLFTEERIGKEIKDRILSECGRMALYRPSDRKLHCCWDRNLLITDKMPHMDHRKDENAWESDLDDILLDLISDTAINDILVEGETEIIMAEARLKYSVDENSLIEKASHRGIKAGEVKKYFCQDRSFQCKS